MGSRNYLVNTEDMTLTDRKEYKVKALAAGLERCSVRGIGNVNADIPDLQGIPDSDKGRRVDHIAKYIRPGIWPDSVDQRELVAGPARTDFTAATTPVLDAMFTAALAVVGVAYTCFQAIAAPQLLNNRLLVFWGFSMEPPMGISHLIFRKGGAAGNVVAIFDVQTQNTRLAYDTFFSEPIVFDPQEVFAVQAVCRIATGVAHPIHLHNFLFGPAGQTIL